ncbi:MAG: histidine phosphatase family protein [Rhodobacteraceae bacterium]|nr:histidine phosphatase family protein [Paracoccaceae bacterium]
MKRLILIRHAKSSWSSGASADKSRPLNDRGRAAATKIGAWLNKQGYMPDEVISSSATRCAQTWDGISEILGKDADLRFDDTLYLASAHTMLKQLQTASGDAVMMLGHMPGIGEFARDLRRDPAPAHETFQKYPTGAVTVLDFKVDNWADVLMGTGKFVDYVAPREL